MKRTETPLRATSRRRQPSNSPAPTNTISAWHCGVVGLKPSADAIPSPFGFGGAYGPLDGVTAPMGRTVADARMAFEVMAGPDPRDPHSMALLDVPPPATPRIAVSPRLGLNVSVDADVMAAFQAASALLYGSDFPVRR